MHVIDDNECELNNGGCSQNCNNTLGSYMCSCEEGYSLNFDRFNCSGKQINNYGHLAKINTEMVMMPKIV